MRYLVSISYDGSRYCGWQKQAKGVSIQGVCEDVLQKIVGSPIVLNASGRTDAGVSAICQTAHFDCEIELNRSIIGHANSILPDDIKILDIKKVSNDFHARYDVKQKTYKYRFYLSKQPIPFYDRFATQIKSNVDMGIFENNLNKLLGTHDFSSFCASNTSVVDKTRTIFEANVAGEGILYEFTISGDGFLYNMVRIIVGTLIDIASGKLDHNMAEIISSKNRANAGKTLSGKGLTLYKVSY